jgi:uncharacterized membrane protein YraQ (UPF0718 family)
LKLGVARAVGAVVFSVVIGLLMHLIFRKEELAKAAAAAEMPEPEVKRPLWQNIIYFASMIGVLVFANWGKPAEASGLWHFIWMAKWPITSVFAVVLAVVLVLWFGMKWWQMLVVAVPAALAAIVLPGEPMIPFVVGVVGLSIFTSTNEGETGEWFSATWTFAKQITPLLLFGVLAAGFFLGRPGHEGVIPSEWVTQAVGGNSLRANLLSSVVGAFMYFATLTEVPILQGLLGSGMGQGPALALLLAGPALSLQSMLVLRTIMGTKKTVVYVLLVIGLSTMTGLIFGALS